MRQNCGHGSHSAIVHERFAANVAEQFAEHQLPKKDLCWVLVPVQIMQAPVTTGVHQHTRE